MSALNVLLFRVGARAYDELTRQDWWRGQVRRLLDYVDVRRGPRRVLDLGCGPGVSALALAEALPPGSEVVGVDLSPEMVARARAQLAARSPLLRGVHFLRADACRLPLRAGSFDLVTGHSFLYLVPDRQSALREARRVLASDGALVFMEPNRDGSLARAALEGLPRLPELARSPFAAGRFLTSMVLWRAASAVAGRMHADLLGPLFAGAGFREVHCHETLGGLGLHVVARGTAGGGGGP